MKKILLVDIPDDDYCKKVGPDCRYLRIDLDGKFLCRLMLGSPVPILGGVKKSPECLALQPVEE